jgi:hypothetical protein
MSPCSIAAADRRLRDAFHHWRKLERSYFQPDEFRINLNSFFQEARNVTFILQKNKKKVPDFDTWYVGWQTRLRDDGLMRWAIDSRNKITKQGDLETESQNIVTFISGWTDDFMRRFTASPTIPSAILIEHALAKIPKELLWEESLLCVERRWVDIALPGRELLSATSSVLIVLSELIRDGHAFIQKVDPDHKCDLIEKLTQMRQQYPIDIANADQSRKIWIKAEKREEIHFRLRDENISQEAMQMSGERYGDIHVLPERTRGPTLEDAVLMYMEAAKRFLVIDGHLMPFVFVLEAEGGELKTMALQMADRAEKHIAIRQVASYLQPLDIDWAILLSEAWWIRPEEMGPDFCHAAHSKHRREAIAVEGVAHDGHFCHRRVEFSRRGKEIILGEEHQSSESVNILLPIRNAIYRERE